MKLVDLSHPISNEMVTYPSDPDVSIVKEKDIDSNRTLLHRFTMGTHTGTHLDAPAHIISGGKTLRDLPLSSYTGKTVKVCLNTISDLNNIDEKVDGIIFDSGWYKKFKEPEIYYGTNRPEIPKHLVEKAISIGVKFFGCDLPSVDKSGSKNKFIHNALLGSDIVIYESLTNLDMLPMLTLFDFYGFPLPFFDLEGSPVRAVGLIH